MNGVGSGASAFGLDPASGLGMDIIREDTSMYMNSDMMAFFADGGVDVNHLFSSDTFLQQQRASPPSGGGSAAAGPQGQQGQSQQPGAQDGFMKMAGLVPSP